LPERLAFRQAANVAQAFGHDAQAWAKYQCQSHARIFMGTVDDSPSPWVEDPMATVVAVGYFTVMNTLLIIVVLLLLFGGGGFYFGGPVIGGSGLGLILLICLVIFFMGGFRTTKN
jgi:exosortase/archaeosortase